MRCFCPLVYNVEQTIKIDWVDKQQLYIESTSFLNKSRHAVSSCEQYSRCNVSCCLSDIKKIPVKNWTKHTQLKSFQVYTHLQVFFILISFDWLFKEKFCTKILNIALVFSNKALIFIHYSNKSNFARVIKILH